MKMAILEWMTLKFYKCQYDVIFQIQDTFIIINYTGSETKVSVRIEIVARREKRDYHREKRKEYQAFVAVVIDWCFLFSTTLCSESANSEYDWTYNSEFYSDHCPFSLPINLASCFFFILLSYLAKCHRMHWKQFNRIPIRVKILHLHYHSRSHR